MTNDLDRSRLVIVGEAPTTRASIVDLTGMTSRRLVGLSGLTREVFVQVAARINLVESPQPMIGGGRGFDRVAGRIRAAELTRRFTGRRLMLLGRRVSSSFGLDGEYLSWELVRPWATLFCVVPHPSGMNRWWNTPENRFRAGVFLAHWFKVEALRVGLWNPCPS